MHGLARSAGSKTNLNTQYKAKFLRGSDKPSCPTASQRYAECMMLRNKTNARKIESRDERHRS
jgi:hypothetical protein